MWEKARYCYRVRPARTAMLSEGPTEEEAAVLEAHGAYVKARAEQGVVLLAGRTLNTDARAFGIVILAEEEERAAEAVMRNDPAVAQGVMHAELFPFRVAFTAAGGA